MTPIEFKEQNVVFAKDQPEYLPLPAFKNNSPQGEVISCWKLSFRERIKILITGKLWICLLSFNNPLTPYRPSVFKSEMFNIPTDRWNTLIQKIFTKSKLK